MKNKDLITTNSQTVEKNIAPENKVKSLRPMRSMMAVRSFKPKTAVATMTVVRPATETK